MRAVKFTKPYKFAENGFEYTEFFPGDNLTVSDSCADSAIQAGCAVEAREGKAVAPEANKSLGSAPENKSAGKRGVRKPRNS